MAGLQQNPGTLLRKQIPIKTNQWDEARPGFLEADTAAYCGTSMAGMFAFTIDCVDIATGWTEQRALWGKGETDVLEQIEDIETSLWRLFHNFFCPSVKLIAKERIASKTIKRYDIPKTPYQRVIESPYISVAVKQSLREQFEKLNPFHLRKAMEEKLKRIFNLCYKKHVESTSLR